MAKQTAAKSEHTAGSAQESPAGDIQELLAELAGPCPHSVHHGPGRVWAYEQHRKQIRCVCDCCGYEWTRDVSRENRIERIRYQPRFCPDDPSHGRMRVVRTSPTIRYLVCDACQAQAKAAGKSFDPPPDVPRLQ